MMNDESKITIHLILRIRFYHISFLIECSVRITFSGVFFFRKMTNICIVCNANITNMHMFSKLDTYVTLYFHLNKNHGYYLLTEKQKDILNVNVQGYFLNPI